MKHPTMTISLTRAQAHALRPALAALRADYNAEYYDPESNEDRPALRAVIAAHDKLLAQLRSPTEPSVTVEGDCTVIADAVWLYLLLSLERLNADIGGLPLGAIDAPDALQRLAHIKHLITLAPTIAQQAEHEHRSENERAGVAA